MITAHRSSFRTTSIFLALAALAGMIAHSGSALAQSPADWLTGLQQQVAPGAPEKPKEEAGDPTAIVQVPMTARLTADGEEIEEGLVWRVFGRSPGGESGTALLFTQQQARPTFKLRTGDYVVNAAFGRAHITRRISVKPGQTDGVVEDFVLNAGGLRVKAQVGGSDAPQNTVSFSIYSDRDQTDNRKLILSAARPNLVVRLNAGIYHIVSTYGDCNAVVRSDVTVEAGKLTEAIVTPSAAKATLKLVHRALPDTQWTIQTPEGEEIKESVGALPTHILAPGKYVVLAKSQGRSFQREITLANGETTQVELVMN
jgi:hypothetical protein